MPQLINEFIKTADFKNEKHVPVIKCPDSFTKDQMTAVEVAIGEEIAHPNTTEHHIGWIELYFMPEGAKFISQIARFEFLSHGATVNGPNTGSVHTHHAGTVHMKTSEPGTLFATAYCNIHGLWQGSREIKVM